MPSQSLTICKYKFICICACLSIDIPICIHIHMWVGAGRSQYVGEGGTCHPRFQKKIKIITYNQVKYKNLKNPTRPASWQSGQMFFNLYGERDQGSNPSAPYVFSFFSITHFPPPPPGALVAQVFTRFVIFPTNQKGI